MQSVEGLTKSKVSIQHLWMNCFGVQLSKPKDHLARYQKLIEHDMIGDTREIWESHLTSTQKSIFLCHALIRTIDACLSHEYIAFDAHTTSNCCHGMSLLVRDLIHAIQPLDLHELKALSHQKILELQNNPKMEVAEFTTWIPQAILALTSLYLLAFVRDIDGQKRMRTEARKLKSISEVGVSFCWDIANELKIHFSTMVANSYRLYLREINPSMELNGVPVNVWGSYVGQDHLRTDKRNVNYASCIYSTQVSLAFLIASKSKVALVNDIINSSGEFVDRFICIFEGDGSKLKPLSECELERLAANHSEPIVVFAGYVRSDTLNVKTLSKRMQAWLDQFPRLMMACDVFYPQFPQVGDDPEFNSAPIIPKEERLRKLFINHSMVHGVSAADSSLFCSSHTYPASLSQILKALKEKNASALPTCFHSLQIPHTDMWGIEMRESLSSEEDSMASV